MNINDPERLRSFLETLIKDNLNSEHLNWLKEKTSAIQSGDKTQLNTTFAAMPRKTGKAIIVVSEEAHLTIGEIRNHFTIRDWSIDRLCRVWILMHIPNSEKDNYVNQIENLFLAAEMNESVALYSSLPILYFPEQWKMRCAEGIRSNIGSVLESIICDNPYPSEYLDEPAWNQLVLKAFFTEKQISRIIGVDERANQELAEILSDYAHERWAAHRSVNPQLWRCVSKFVNDKIFPDIERIAYSENTIEMEAAALVCRECDYSPAKALMNKNSFLKSMAKDPSLTWKTLANKALLSY